MTALAIYYVEFENISAQMWRRKQRQITGNFLGRTFLQQYNKTSRHPFGDVRSYSRYARISEPSGS